MHLRNRIALATILLSLAAFAGEVPAHSPPDGWTSTEISTGVGYVSADRTELLWLSPLVRIGGDLENVLNAFKSPPALQKSPAMYWEERDGTQGVMRQDVVELNEKRQYRLGAVKTRGTQGVCVFLFSPRSIQETKVPFVRFLDSVQLPGAGALAPEGVAPRGPSAPRVESRFESIPSQHVALPGVIETAPLSVSLVGDWVHAGGISIKTLERRTPTHDLIRTSESGYGIVYSFLADGTYEILYMTHTAQGLAGTVREWGRWRLAGETVELIPKSSKLVIEEANKKPWVKEEHPPKRVLTVHSVRVAGFQVGSRPTPENGGIQLEGPCASWYMESCGASSGGTTSHTLQRLR